MTIGLGSFASGLWAGLPYRQALDGTIVEEALPGSAISQPPGLEALLEYNGIIMHDRSVVDKYRVLGMDGLQGADIRDNREANPSDHGETPFDNYIGGRTIILEGKIEAHNIGKLRDMQQALRTAFYSMQERPLIFRLGTTADRDVQIFARMIDKISMKEEQNNLDPHRRFQITLRASDPRFRSVVSRIYDAPLGYYNSFDQPTTVSNTNLIRNPHPAINTNGFSPNGGSLTLNSYGSISHTAAGAGQGPYFSGASLGGQIAVTAGKEYTFSLKNISAVAGRTHRLIIEFRNAANAVLTTPSVTIGTPANNTRYSITATAPATATQILLDYYATGSVAGDVTTTSEWCFNEGTNAEFFSGDTPLRSPYRRVTRWTGTPHSTTSQELDLTTTVLPDFDPYSGQSNGTKLVMSSVPGEGLTYGYGVKTLSADVKSTVQMTTPLAWPNAAFWPSAALLVKTLPSTQGVGARLTLLSATTARLDLVKGATVLASSATFAITLGSSYWVQASIAGDVMTGQVFSTDPYGGGGTPLSAVVTYTLLGTDSTTYGAGIVGKPGFQAGWAGDGATWVFDDLRVEPGPTLNLNVAQPINQGNFEALPIVRIYGPMSNVTVTNDTIMPDETAARFLKINGAIPAGRYYEYNAQKGTLVDDLGANKFGQYDVSSKPLKVGAGTNNFSIVASSASTIAPRVTIEVQDTWI